MRLRVFSAVLCAWLVAGAVCVAEEPAAEGASSDASEATFAFEPLQPVMGEMVQYYMPQRIALADKPAEELSAQPEYASEKPLYGALTLGIGEDNQFTLVLDEPAEGTARIYIDRNNDEDLTNDGDGAWSTANENNLFLSGVVVDAEYDSGVIPYTVEMYRFTQRLRDTVLCYRNSGRLGEIASGGQTYKAALLDENADGRFDDLDSGTLLLDHNGDGVLVGRPDSPEMHKLGEPFNVHGQVWQVASVSPNGLELTLRPSDADVAMQRYLEVGYEAAAFEATGLDDQPIALAKNDSEAGPKYILLDFWASWCGPCRGEYPFVRRAYARYREHGLAIIGVSLDSEKAAAQQAVADERLAYPHVFDGGGWENAVAKLYRVQSIPATYLLDADLKIVAKNLRGEALEKKLEELLGEGDRAAADAVDQPAEGDEE